MRKYTNTEKAAGEQATRRMSEKAQRFYSQTDLLNVYEYDGGKNMPIQAYLKPMG